jgi:pyruvate/2-oxoglutarate dehydrogenase complex dihydrolipoamide acyltransferase (E2) component
MKHEFVLPELGEDEDADAAEVSFWYIQEGESVEEGQDVVEMVTDKAAFTVPAPVSGTLAEVKAQEGDEVDVGGVLGIIES